MKKIENCCCDCAVPGYPCRGESCELRHVEVYYCDNCDPKCDEPLDEVFEVEGKDLCLDCLKRLFEKF
ncbi:MAG: hypothetical protein U0M06_09570 [Clostridia bacterium]|nr:hypothetical protein [Clostridia bacterium]